MAPLVGAARMDIVSHTLSVAMETGSAQMAVMNSIVVSVVLFACLNHLSYTLGASYCSELSVEMQQ